MNVAGTTQAGVSPATLTFTPANWNTPQVVTITASDDTVSEVSTYDNIVFTTNTSQPAGFTSLSATVVATTLDNDEISAISAISIIQTNGATRVHEGGMTDTFELVLRRAPSANVTLTASYSATGQVTVSPTSFVFTPLNWNVPQTVTVTPTEDTALEGNHSVNVIFTASNSGGYTANDTVLQTVSIGDNEGTYPGVSIATSGSATEGGATGTITVSLAVTPSAGATVRVTPTAYLLNATTTSQVTFSPTSVDFNTTNWATPQVITVTAVNDSAAEPSVGLTIVSSTATVGGTDNRYNGMVAPDVAFTVVDNETTGRINIAHTGGSTVLAEDIGTETVEISLIGPAPTADVIVTLTRALSDMRFVVNGSHVDSTTLTFTPGNYATAQTVNLVVIADTGSEGLETETLNATTASAAPANWASLSASLPVRVLDSDDMTRALINIIPTNGYTGVIEGGATDTYQVVLRRAPSANVTLDGNYNNTQISVSPADLTFTPTNWNVPQTVTITAVDDPDVENLHSSAVTYIASFSGGYLPSDQAVVTANIGDNETLGGAALIAASESGGYTFLKESTTLTATDNYTLVLGAPPTGNVTLTPVVNNAVSTTTNLVSFSPATVTFTTANWNTPQNVTINLAPSSADNGTRALFVGHRISTADANYKVAIPPNVNAIVADANSTTAAVVTVPTGQSTSVYEGTPGNTDSIYVFLRRPPNVGTSVTVTPTLNNNVSPYPAIAGQVSFSPSTLTFTDANWNTPQILTVTATNDATPEAQLNALLICTPSAGNGYAVTNTNGTTLPVTVNDNDAAGQLVFSQPTPTLLEGGGSTYTIALSSAPTASVTVTIVTQKHAVPQPAYALDAGYFSSAATGSNLQKDNMLFDWSELTTLYTTAYTAGLGGTESATTAPNGHRAGTKAVIDKLDQLWGGGWMKSRWPDGAPAADNPRQLIIDGILNCYSITTLSTDTTNFPAQVRDRCRFAAHLVSVSPSAITSH